MLFGMTSVAVRDPIAVGLNFTPIVHVSPAASRAVVFAGSVSCRAASNVKSALAVPVMDGVTLSGASCRLLVTVTDFR